MIESARKRQYLEGADLQDEIMSNFLVVINASNIFPVVLAALGHDFKTYIFGFKLDTAHMTLGYIAQRHGCSLRPGIISYITVNGGNRDFFSVIKGD